MPKGDEITNLVIVDCEKTRKARDQWRADPKNLRLKNLGAAAQLSRIFGTEGGLKAPYSRVTLRSLRSFAEKVKRPWQEFQADLTEEEYNRWYREWEARREASKQAKSSKDPTLHKQIEALNNDLRGYYELYHQATTKKFSNEISLSLVHINGIDVERSAVKCELHDNNKSRPSFQLSGHIAARHGFLFWELGSNSLGTVCHAICYGLKGQKRAGVTLLRGIFLTVSGDDNYEYPVAAKGVMRFIGETASEANRHCLLEISTDETDLHTQLQDKVGGYLSDLQENDQVKPLVMKEIREKILPMIHNAISADAAPLALAFRQTSL